MIFSFIAFLIFFALVGVSSALRSKATKQDYYLASSSIPSALVGLSAVATNNSGYMFIGVIGYTYTTGLASVWLMIGWIFGDYIGSTFIHSRLRKATERTGEASFAGVLSNWNGSGDKIVQRIIALITLVFLLAYASAQLVAGSKALHVLFGWPNWAGAAIGAFLVTLYCISGGIRASIWTDAAQSVVMICAMILLLYYCIDYFGGFSASVHEMSLVDGFLNWFPDQMIVPGITGVILFIVGWAFAGLSVIGQPHIMVRFMTLNDSSKMRHARIWYYSWFILFYAMATMVGMLSRIYLNNPASFDAELALPTMAKDLLPPVLVGIILAGIFAATMSTADSLVLSCSAALTHDLLPQKIEKTWLLKIGTGIITLIAFLLALFNNQSVFNLVIMSWSALASAFGPLLIFLAFGQKPSRIPIVLSIIGGLSISLIWRYMGWHETIYEGLPGITGGLAILWIASLSGKNR